MNRLHALLERYRVRRARRHYDRAITRVNAALEARQPAPAHQRDLDLATIRQIWDHTLDHEMGADQ